MDVGHSCRNIKAGEKVGKRSVTSIGYDPVTDFRSEVQRSGIERFSCLRDSRQRENGDSQRREPYTIQKANKQIRINADKK
jgi:hypothetical protein